MENQYPPQLELIMNSIGEDFNVPDDEYEKWKEQYDALPEYEKVQRLLDVLSQYLTSGDSASASILATAVVCTRRWCNEKEWDEF